MTSPQRTAIARIIIDIIKADRVIETDEMHSFDLLTERFGIGRQDLVAAYSFSFADAVSELTAMPFELQQEVLDAFLDLANSNGACLREEALLLLALKYCLSDMGADADVLSVKIEERWFDHRQILYVEPESSGNSRTAVQLEKVNDAIRHDYRIISTELRLAGFDFIYIPKVVERFLQAPESFISRVTLMLDPVLSEGDVSNFIKRLRNFTTAGFCKGQLADKLGFKALSQRDDSPSLMFRVGISRVNKEVKTNFLRVFIPDADVTATVRKICDSLSEMLSLPAISVPTLHEASGEFPYSGFYRQFFDILLLEPVVKNKLFFDLVKDRFPIRFLPSGSEFSGLSRKEKAFYFMMVCAIPRGGIKFPTPLQVAESEKSRRKMQNLQSIYNDIYRAFGGDVDAAVPDISSPGIRNPILANIRRKIDQFIGAVSNIADFQIIRNNAGYYCIQAQLSDFLCVEPSNFSEHPVAESAIFNRLNWNF